MWKKKIPSLATRRGRGSKIAADLSVGSGDFDFVHKMGGLDPDRSRSYSMSDIRRYARERRLGFNFNVR